MQTSRDSSVWRTLALAFGDGLAFGVGVTLTRNAARLGAAKPAPPEPHAANGWSREVEQRATAQRAAETPAAESAVAAARTAETRTVEAGTVENRPGTADKASPVPSAALNHPTADAVLTLIDGRFSEIGGRMDRRLAGLELKVNMELDNLDVQDHALAEGVESRVAALRTEIAEAVATQRQSIDADMRGLRAQMTAVHKEFAETLARFMDEQIAKTIGVRMQAVEAGLRETIREEIRQQGPDPRVAELHGRVEAQEQNVLNLVMALGQSCLRAVERIAPHEPPHVAPQGPPQAPPPPSSGAPEGGPPPAADANADPHADRGADPADPDLPGFARTRPRKPLWRVPIVSSFLAATGGLLLLHYL